MRWWFGTLETMKRGISSSILPPPHWIRQLNDTDMRRRTRQGNFDRVFRLDVEHVTTMSMERKKLHQLFSTCENFRSLKCTMLLFRLQRLYRTDFWVSIVKRMLEKCFLCWSAIYWVLNIGLAYIFIIPSCGIYAQALLYGCLTFVRKYQHCISTLPQQGHESRVKECFGNAILIT